eukprot:NODE_694_length_5096_cov_0.086652.p3 type:complete len:162 gc:universal NODE_694_length_5096_cov_0.086652:2113-2598(+)
MISINCSTSSGVELEGITILFSSILFSLVSDNLFSNDSDILFRDSEVVESVFGFDLVFKLEGELPTICVVTVLIPVIEDGTAVLGVSLLAAGLLDSFEYRVDATEVLGELSICALFAGIGGGVLLFIVVVKCFAGIAGGILAGGVNISALNCLTAPELAIL